MTTISELVSSLDMDFLCACATDILAWQKKGILKSDSNLKKLADRLTEELGIDKESNLSIAEQAVLKHIAVLFLAERTNRLALESK